MKGRKQDANIIGDLKVKGQKGRCNDMMLFPHMTLPKIQDSYLLAIGTGLKIFMLHNC